MNDVGTDGEVPSATAQGDPGWVAPSDFEAAGDRCDGCSSVDQGGTMDKTQERRRGRSARESEKATKELREEMREGLESLTQTIQMLQATRRQRRCVRMAFDEKTQDVEIESG